MADGNIGSLWLSLGIRDEMSKAIEKITKGMRGVDEATQKAKREGESLVKALEGINGNNFARVFREANAYILKNSSDLKVVRGILAKTALENAFTGSLLGAKDLSKAAKELLTINAKLASLPKDDRTDEVAKWRTKISNALDYIKLLQDIIGQEKKLDNTKALNPNVDTKSLDSAKKSLEDFRREMIRLLQSGGVDESNVLGGFKKMLDVAKKDVQDIVATFKKDNPLSLFSGGAAKVETDLARVTEKLARLRDLMAEGTRKGFMTDMLGGSITELDKIMARLNAAKLNPTMLTDASQMRNLISDVLVEMTKATVAESAYRRERGKTVEVERAVNQEISNEHKAAQQERERDLQALSDYTKRYMELQEAKRKADEKAAKDAKDKARRQSEAEQRRIASDTAKMSRLYASMGLGIGKGGRVGMRGLELGVNTAALDKALSEATKFKKTIENTVVSMMGKGDRPAYEWYAAQVNRLKENLTNATAAQKELNAAQEKANRKAESDDAKRRADEKRREAQAARELAQAEKQRQNQLEVTRSRIQSMERALHNLQEKRFTAKMLGIDTSEANAKIEHLKTQLIGLRDIQLGLSMGDTSFLGRVGNLGNGREVQAANQLSGTYSRLIGEVEKTNREKEKSIELERAHQQEVARTAAKVRGDLAAAFAGANAEAGNMRGVLDDVKSLLLQGGIVYGAKQFFDSVVKTGGEIAQQHIALRSILGDAAKADELFEQTQQLALRSPFKFGELNRDVKQLAAFGVEADDLYNTAKRLADIASGLGVSFERLGLAYGQVKARSWLDGKELRQFAYAGLPLLARITELYNSEGKNNRKDYTERDVKEMISKRQVSFEDVQKVLWKMTDEGGQFYNMQLVLSETLLGRWNKLIDAWEIMLSKFADGKNVVGGVFMFFIDRATDLVLAMDKLTPAMLSFMSVFALKKLTGFASLNPLEKNLGDKTRLQLRSYAIEQQQLVLEGKITQQIATQNVQKRAYMLADASSRSAAMSRLALEGKMSVVQMQKAVKEGLVSKELIRQLAIMGQITARQEQIILNGGRTAAVMNMAGTKLKSGFSSVFNLIGGWWGLAIGGIVQIASSIYGELSAIEEKTKSLQDPNSEWMKGYYDVLDAKKASNDAELRKQIEQMKKVLESSNAYTKTIDEQIKKAKDLNEQYEILRKGVEGAKNMASGDAEVIANAIGATGGWVGAGNPFNDSLEKNLQDMKESSDAYQRQLSALDSRTRAKMESVANSLLKPADASKTLEEKIRILSEEGGRKWGTFQARMTKWNKSIAFSIHSIGKKAGDVTSDINQIAEDDVPRIIKSMQKDFGLYGKDFKRWCKENPARFKNMLLQIMSEADWLIPQIRKKLEELTDFKFDSDKKPNQVTGKTSMQQRVYENLGLDQRKYDLVSSFIEERSWYKTKNNAHTALQDLANEVRSRERGGATKAEIAKARKDYNDMWNAVAQGFGYRFIPEDKKSNKVPKDKGDKEDKELKAWEERLNAFKSARQMYQKYKSIMSDEEAKKKTYNLFPEVTGLNLDDYQKAVHSLLEGFSINTTERKKFQTSIYREVAEWLFDEKDKKEYERKAADFTELLNRLSSQWDLYKELFSKTGDKNFSGAAFSNPGYIDDKAKELIVEYNNKFGKDFQRENAMSMSDGVAKETLKGPGEYEAWKNIVDLLRSNYIKILQDAADIIEKTEDYEDKILKIRERYNELISKTNDPGIKARYEIQRDKEIGQVKLDKFKNSSDYLNFYGAIVSLGMDKAQAIGARIRQNINEALQNGAIDAREYAKEIKQLDEQLSKLEKLRPSFLNGGLEGIVNAKKERANDMINLGSSQYNKAKEDFNKAKINGDLDGMAAAANSKAAGEKMMEGGEKLLKGASKMSSTISMIDTIIHGINDIVQGANDTFQDIKSTASALGIDTESDGWTDANSFFEGFSSSSASATKAWESLKSGNVGGVVSGVVGSFTGWIKAFSAGHDAKLDRQIKLAERELKALENMQTTIKNAIEDSLGGIYNYRMDAKTTAKMNKIVSSYETGEKSSVMRIFGFNPSEYSKDTYEAAQKSLADPTNAYQAELTGLMAQRDQLQRQRANEDAKKKTDKDKLADYDQQIEEMERSIKNAAKNFLNELYGVDMKSWASQLTDAVVSAWEKGEDAIDAYKKKAKEMVKDLTKNIISQKIMEQALQKPLDFLTQQIEKKSRLDEYDVTQLASDLYSAGENSVANITAVLEELKRRGWDFSESGSSSTTNTIKGVTEETADLLAAYLNAIRLDVSVNRENIKAIATNVSLLPAMSEIQKSQLAAMNQLVTLAQVRNDRIDEIVTWTRKVSNGSSKIYVK